MKLKFPLIAAFAAMLTLTACGGGSDDKGPNTPAVTSPATLTKVDISIGTGAEAVAGKRVTTQYTLWLYSATATDFKGTRLEAGSLKPFVVGDRSVIPGYDQGVTGMRAGGKRTVLVPTALGYGSQGQYPVPPNSGLVFEITLDKVE